MKYSLCFRADCRLLCLILRLDAVCRSQPSNVLTVVMVSLQSATPCVRVFPAVMALAKNMQVRTPIYPGDLTVAIVLPGTLYCVYPSRFGRAELLCVPLRATLPSQGSWVIPQRRGSRS